MRSLRAMLGTLGTLEYAQIAVSGPKSIILEIESHSNIYSLPSLTLSSQGKGNAVFAGNAGYLGGFPSKTVSRGRYYDQLRPRAFSGWDSDPRQDYEVGWVDI